MKPTMKPSKQPKPSTYKDAGVDIDKRQELMKNFINLMIATFKFREKKTGKVLMDVGNYANLVEFGDYGIAFKTDGVGTKVLIAQELDKYDTVGIDMLAMNVNDLICVGAEPIALVDYIALQSVNEKILNGIAKGIYEGAKQANVAIIGGETAIVPDLIKGINAQKKIGFDLSGTALGIVKKDKIIDGSKIKVNDVVIGFNSNGIHSNGLTLARKVLPKKFYPEILKPTKIYVKEILEIINNYDVHGLAHITGGGYRNLLRLTNYGFKLENLPDLNELHTKIFAKIQEYGNINDEEMYNTFNMGIGFCVVVNKKDASEILKNYNCRKIGKVITEHKVLIEMSNKKIEILKEK
ncbi:MAG: phosphoribosylformylglycinamidine cyclo-ligase [Candidatus Altarchaeum sp.]|nr:phosphoribosylformylglycinamidine cyclo-ligase [Candidatus Altarchaeum sp.]